MSANRRCEVGEEVMSPRCLEDEPIHNMPPARKQMCQFDRAQGKSGRSRSDLLANGAKPEAQCERWPRHAGRLQSGSASATLENRYRSVHQAPRDFERRLDRESRRHRHGLRLLPELPCRSALHAHPARFPLGPQSRRAVGPSREPPVPARLAQPRSRRPRRPAKRRTGCTKPGSVRSCRRGDP